MRIGAIIPSFGRLPADPGLTEIGPAAEAAGAQGLWVDDHLLEITEPGSRYPYAADGVADWASDQDRYESLTCCSWLAATTKSCRVGTAVLILPQRNPLELAKTTASIQRLSGDRFALGVGVGWRRAEMEALGYSFSTRGRRADETIATLRACWSGRPDPTSGNAVEIPAGLMMMPTASVPLLVGGMSPPALRRAAARGDGWLAVSRLGELDVDALAASLSRLEQLREESGRADGSFATVLKLHSGTATEADLPRAIAAVAAAGFTELIIEPDWQSPERALATIGRARAVAEPS